MQGYFDVTPRTVLVTPKSKYDFDEILQLRKKKKSWRDIAVYYSVTHPSPLRWFQRKKTENQKHILTSVSKQIVKTIIAPAFVPYISPLSHDEWAEKYCHHYWKTDYLTEMSDHLWEDFRVLCTIPREHGKSLRSAVLFARYILEIALPLLVITGGPANQRRIWNRVRFFLRSPAILKDYPQAHFLQINGQTKEITWNDKYLGPRYLGLDPLFRIASRGAEIVGSHPYWIHLEDLVQEMFRSEESNTAMIDWFEGIIEFCAQFEEGKETRITLTGTRKEVGDFYEYLIVNLNYPTYLKAAIELIDGNWPTIQDIKKLEGGRYEVDTSKGTYKTLECPGWPVKHLLYKLLTTPVKFQAEMQNDPLPAGGKYFDPTAIQYWDGSLPARTSMLFMYCDPAFGKQKSADFVAIIVIAWDKGNNRFYVLEHFLRKNMNFDDIVTNYKDIHAKYLRLGFFFEYLGTETNFWQAWYQQQLLKMAIPVIGVDNQQNKHERIQSLRPYFSVGMIYMCKENPYYSEAFNQYIHYDCTDSTATRKDDFLDALQGAIIAIHLGTEETWA